jgi:hypothetical protein
MEFYQGLFGMPVQARESSTVLLRIGNGPPFLALRLAASTSTFSVKRESCDAADAAVINTMNNSPGMREKLSGRI